MSAVVYIAEGWWHPNVNAGRVHDHPSSPGRSWSTASHRECEPVYTKRVDDSMLDAWKTAVAEGHTIDGLDGWTEFELRARESEAAWVEEALARHVRADAKSGGDPVAEVIAFLEAVIAEEANDGTAAPFLARDVLRLLRAGRSDSPSGP